MFWVLPCGTAVSLWQITGAVSVQSSETAEHNLIYSLLGTGTAPANALLLSHGVFNTLSVSRKQRPWAAGCARCCYCARILDAPT
jgi:hypothetical protein